MPLVTELKRNDTVVPLRWGWWHVECIKAAIEAEGAEWEMYQEYTFKEEHAFVDPSDGEEFTIQAGDVYSGWKEWN